MAIQRVQAADKGVLTADREVQPIQSRQPARVPATQTMNQGVQVADKGVQTADSNTISGITGSSASVEHEPCAAGDEICWVFEECSDV